jgi:excisionase family DNA binding protein
MYANKIRHQLVSSDPPDHSLTDRLIGEAAMLFKGAVTVDTYCRATSLGRTKFYDLVKAKKIQILKAGRRTLVPVSEIQAFLDRIAEDGGSK